MRPITQDVYDTVADLACGMTNATCADDVPLHDSLYQQLLAFYEDQRRRGTLHPFVVETLADYTEDRPEALRFYREALAISEPDEPRYTILISMAERLIEVGERDQAEACLRDGRAEAEGRNDSESVVEADRVLREVVAEPGAAPNGGPATPLDISEAADGPPSVS
jgi:tetratricopeptide (TPR) repeat protein